ncbi:unnamed protein product [Caenorhabditis bovis]|uniref:Uncharacterized protein n=1 Tax=Caenorhabditis bovis TaxID=2654633 RepID=A0A8S1EW68_9PELO|nr:unnamed protein product [Caenorhabditis bovis]
MLSCVLLMFLVLSSVIATQSSTFDRQDRDYRPLQFGKRDGYHPLQFGKREYRPLQFGKRSGMVYEPVWEMHK